MTTDRGRATLMGAGIGAGVGVSLLLLQYTCAMPTSDLRARLHFLLASAPWSVGGPLLGFLLVAALLGVVIAGWRTPWAYLGAALGAGFAFGLLLTGVFGYLVWPHTADVSRARQWARAAGVVLFAAAVLAWARHARRSRAAA